MAEILVVNHPAYHRERSQRPRNFAQFVDLVCASPEDKGKIKGIWEFVQSDPKTGRPKKRLWVMNTVTDNGAVNILASAIANASNANPWNNILITNNSGSTTLTTALAANAPGVTTLAVAAVPAAIPSGTTLQLGYGTGNTQTVVTNGATSQGATSITVNSFTVNATGFGIGQAVVPQPSVADNPTNAALTSNASSPLSQYSGVITAAGFTYSPTTGAGNRSVVVTFVFKNSTNGGSTPNGSYTDAWLVNVTSGASNATTGLFVGNYVAHEINTPMRCDNNNNLTATVTVKI
jgi:hypothetical protein